MSEHLIDPLNCPTTSMTEYHITWQIDVEADSPEHAARRAYDAFCRSGSTAHVFEVTPTDETMSGIDDVERVTVTNTIDIDLGWETGGDGQPASYPMSEEG